MSDAKINKLQARIDEIMGRTSYGSTPAWRQEVAELRLEIEAMKAGRKPQRKEFARPQIPVAAPAMAAAAVSLSPEDDIDDGHDDNEAGHDEHHDTPYMAIFWTLAILTLIEWKFSEWFGVEGIPLWSALGAMAVVKAVMVALYFMHLKFEKRTIYVLLALPLILVVVIMALLSPDAEQQAWDYTSWIVGPR